MAEDKNVIKWRDRKHWAWFPWSFTKYEVRNDRLYVQKGFFKTSYDETLLYRIVDIRLSRTLAQKIFGTGTVTLFTRVDVNHHIELVNIKDSVAVKEYLSDLVEEIRNRKKVVGKEFYGVMGGADHGGHEHDDLDDIDALEACNDEYADADGDGIPDNEE